MIIAVIFALFTPTRSPVHYSMSGFVLFYSFIVFALLIPCSLCADPNYDTCNNQTCGSASLPYPFAMRDSGCGLPLFQIDCADGERPVIQIESENYTILASDRAKQISTITNDKNFQECTYSYTLGAIGAANSVFDSITSLDTSLTVYRCDDKCVPDILWSSFLSCPKQTEIVQSGSAHWNIEGNSLYQNCSNCTNSGGVCGYNITDPAQFLCYCKNGKKSPNIGAVIGASLGGIALLIAAIFIICKIFRPRRRNHTSEPILVANEANYSESRDIEAGVQEKIGDLPIFSYEILKQATNDFAEEKMLGDGGFGSVYLGKLPDGRAVAVKRMYQNNWKRVDQFINEVQILSSLHHPNLVRLYGCTSPQGKDLLLVYEYVQNGTVADHLHGEKKGKALKWDTRLKICLETAQALQFLHNQEPPVLHRDVKTTNILVDEFFKVKVADFGLSRFMPPDVTHVSTAPQGTPGYLDPEYYEYFQLTEKSDVYSYGVVLVELISSKLAVDINRSRKEISLANMALSKIREGTLHELVDSNLGFEFNDKVRSTVTAVAELAFRCLQASKDDRPGMKEIVAQLEQIEQNWVLVKNPDSHPFGSEGGKKAFSHMAPPSPTSVQDKWSSTQTTPNNSA